MKNIYHTIALGLFASSAAAQITEGTVTTGPGYESQVWYSMENGEIHSAPLNNWDLAFEISGFTASIRVNAQKGVTVYQAPFSVSQWNELDTAGMSTTWDKLYNDNSRWSRGAFNLYPTSEFDLGWGVYNPITHAVTGDSLYVMALANGSFIKLRFDALAGGIYNFTYANPDGTNEISAQVDKDDYTGKNFGYYSLETGEALDREPFANSWDITFLKYSADLGGTAYPVSGVFHNYDVSVAEVSNIESTDPWEAGFSAHINSIGYDWKTFDFEEGWLLDDRNFCVQALNGNIYQLVFTNFEGSSTGVYEFGTSLFSALSTSQTDLNSFSLFPNPAHGEEITINGKFTPDDRIEIFNLNGSLIKEQRVQNLNAVRLTTSGLETGTYLVRIVSQNQVFTQKLTVSQ